MNNYKKNIFYQMSYQIIILVIPLFISPYLANKLGAESVGIYSYAYSIAYIFFIIARLGIVEYGTREIASCKDDNEKTRRTIWTVFFTHATFSMVACIAYCVYVLVFCNINQSVYWTQLLFVISPMLDVTWIYFGLDKFKKLILRNVFVKILEFCLIVILVRKPNNLVIYSLIMSFSYLTGNLIVIPEIIKKYKMYIPTLNEMRYMVKPLFILSVSIVAINIYQIVDKVLLGAMTNTTNVGFYEYSEKLVKVPVHIINSISTVMLPTMSYLAVNKKYDEMKEVFNATAILLSFLSFAFIFGMASVSDVFIQLYYNEQFKDCALYLSLLTPLIFLLTFNNTLRAQFLLPFNKDKEYVVSLLMSFVVNVIASVSLIPYFQVVGAIVGTITAEIVSMIFELIIVRKYISVIDTFKKSIPFLIIGVIMGLFIKEIEQFLPVKWISLLALVTIGGTTYLLLSFIYLFLFDKENLKVLVSQIRKKFRRNKMFKKILRNGLFRRISLFLLKFLSVINNIIPKKNNQIFIYDGTNNYLIDNSLAVVNYLKENDKKHQYVIKLCIPASKNNTELGYINLNVFKGVFAFLTSKYVFYSFGDMRIEPSKNQIVTQLWHGMPFKCFGKLGKTDKEWSDEKLDNFTYYVSTSDTMAETLSRAFGTAKSKTLISGQPRCDFLFRNVVKKVILDRDISLYKKTFLWMPTFRKSSNGRFNDSNDFNSDTGLPVIYSYQMLQELDVLLGKTESLLVIKSHRVAPLDISQMNLKNICLVTNDILRDHNIFLYEFISWFDCLITDYSSVFIDYLLLNRPIIFTIDDFDSYKSGRGFAFEPALDYMPGEKVANYDDFVAALKQVLSCNDEYKDDRCHINQIFNLYNSDFTVRLLNSIGIDL